MFFLVCFFFSTLFISFYKLSAPAATLSASSTPLRAYSRIARANGEGEDDEATFARPAATEPLWALIDRERNSWIDLTAERRQRAPERSGAAVGEHLHASMGSRGADIKMSRYRPV